MHGALNGPRLTTAVALALCTPLGAVVPPLVALLLAIGVLGALIAVETARYAGVRETLRHADA
jgi:uncharacterized membrane protein YfcA